MDLALYSLQLLQVWVLHTLAILVVGGASVQVESGAESGEDSWLALRYDREVQHIQVISKKAQLELGPRSI